MRLKKIICMLLCLAVCLCAVSCASGAESDEKKRIAVIVKSVDSDFWHSFQNGVDAAAVEYNVSVTFEGAENEEDYTAQNELINKAVENGADAIVLSAANYTGTVQAVENAAKMGVKIVTADSGTNSDKVSLFIGTDKDVYKRQLLQGYQAPVRAFKARRHRACFRCCRAAGAKEIRPCARCV